MRLDDGSVIDGSDLLVATGRRANTADLSLDPAGVTVRDDSSIPVDDRLRTNVPSIWAIGDVNGEQPFTRVCQEEAKVAFAAAFEGSDSRIDRLPLGHAVFSDGGRAATGQDSDPRT